MMAIRPATPLRSTYIAAATLLLVGSTIAAIAGFDVIFVAVTRDSAWLRSTLFFALATIGLWCSRRAGLSLLPHGLAHPVAASFGIGFTVAIAIVLIDGVLFRAILPPEYVASFHHGLGERMAYYMLRAFNENILYRLFLMSSIVWALGLVWRNAQGKIPPGAIWFAIISAQAVPMFLNGLPLFSEAITPATILFIVVRFILAGVLWGYLYWRYGFLTTEIAHVSTHIFLQPIMGFALA
jgi:hypothetical protein